MALTIQYCDQLAAVDAVSWDALNTTNNPFLSHRFLAGLEQHGCIEPRDGWQASHILCFNDSELVAALPRYLKGHSWGEFVFDFAWADAAHRAGIAYYPKSIAALPFTPHAGPRLLGNDEAARHAIVLADWQATEAQELSSSHWLFVNDADKKTLASLGWNNRRGVQYHWFNNGYGCFDDYLAPMTSKRRKQIRRERRQVQSLGINIEATLAHQLDTHLWPEVYSLYCSSFLVRGQTPYYSEDFVTNVLPAMADQCLLLLAYDDAELIACAICFVTISAYTAGIGAARWKLANTAACILRPVTTKGLTTAFATVLLALSREPKASTKYGAVLRLFQRGQCIEWSTRGCTLLSATLFKKRP